MLVLHQRREVRQVEQQGAGNVVRQIAHDAQLLAGRHGDLREIKLQRIARVDRQLGRIEGLFQAHDQVAVQLDHVHLLQVAQQLLRHGAQAGADLDHGIVRLRPDGGRDVVEDEAVMQEVLAKAFAGNVFHILFFYSRGGVAG